MTLSTDEVLELSNTYKKLSAYRIFACQEGIVRVPSCKKT